MPFVSILFHFNIKSGLHYIEKNNNIIKNLGLISYS